MSASKGCVFRFVEQRPIGHHLRLLVVQHAGKNAQVRHGRARKEASAAGGYTQRREVANLALQAPLWIRRALPGRCRTPLRYSVMPALSRLPSYVKIALYHLPGLRRSAMGPRKCEAAAGEPDQAERGNPSVEFKRPAAASCCADPFGSPR